MSYWVEEVHVVGERRMVCELVHGVVYPDSINLVGWDRPTFDRKARDTFIMLRHYLDMGTELGIPDAVLHGILGELFTLLWSAIHE